MSQPVVSLQDVRKQYKGVAAVNGVSFEIADGEFFGILGPNGAGKTTLIEIMEGLRRADSGMVQVLGQSPWPRNRDLLPRLGVQTQASAFFESLTAIEHITTVARLYGMAPQRAREALERVGLGEKADTRVKKLSGGQRQRLAIASALTHEPELIFLDEPTAALDPQARRDLWQLLRDIRSQGRTIVYTTHHLDEAEVLCDRVAIINRGGVVALDTPNSLLELVGSSTRLLVPQHRISLDAARGIAGVDSVDIEGGAVVLTTTIPGQVLAAVEQLAGLQGVQTRTATLEDVYLQLTGTEFQV
ncbi:ABC transporter ATP-binding protein [Streptomyces sp. NPDC001250]|uniref:ABC transporter ATP-binding protein n=1 Tax=unclassified Streptomyces TaxID=2593676 RepID=UPI003321D98F